MKFDPIQAIKIVLNPEKEGLPYITGQILGTDKGNAAAPLVENFIEALKDRSIEEMIALAAAIAEIEKGTATS